MRDRRHVADRHDTEPDGRERLDGRLAAAARSLDAHMHPAEPEVHRFAAAVFGSDRGRERRALLRSLEARLAGGSPGEGVALHVGDRDEHVVERRCDVGDALTLDDLLGALAARGRLRGSCHYFFVTFFLPAMARRGPFLVRAFVCVRWPRTGRPRRCRIPRYEPMSINRLMFIATSVRSAPSTRYSFSITCRKRLTSVSERSRIRCSRLTPALERMSTAFLRPMP